MITLNITFPETLSGRDEIGARYIIAAENQARQARGIEALPADSLDNLKSSYIVYLTQRMAVAHESYVATGNSQAGIDAVFTRKQVEQIQTALLSRISKGDSAEKIVFDVEAASTAVSDPIDPVNGEVL